MEKTIVLIVLPFWTPLIPPVGISSLKSFLENNGYPVKTIDSNTDNVFRELYDRYFAVLKEVVPQEKRGNFYNVGHDVLEDHLMAWLAHEHLDQLSQMVELLVSRNYYCSIEDAHIAKLNHVVEDFFASLKDYTEKLVQVEKPGLVGLSIYRGNLAASMFLARHVKEHFPGIKVVAGGAVFSQELGIGSGNYKRFVENFSSFDKIICGEGETLFLKYLEEKLPPDLLVKADGPRDILDVDTLAPPNYDDFDLGHYQYIPVFGSKSCPFQCSFCAETVYWGKYRKKNAAKLVDEMAALAGKYRSQLFLMCDSLLNPTIDGLSREIVNSGNFFYFDGYLRVGNDVSDLERVTKWRQGGFYRARLGVESGSQNVLNLIDKRITVDQVKQSIVNLANLGIKTSTMWIAGHPGETEADFRETLDLIEELKDDIYEVEVNPFRYFETGQVASGEWEHANKYSPLYPEPVAQELLFVRTLVLDCTPPREEVYARLNRFVEHCRNLGIPNPYSLKDIVQADERWQRLQQNAVPPLVEFKNPDKIVTECRQIEALTYAQPEVTDFQGDFDF